MEEVVRAFNWLIDQGLVGLSFLSLFHTLDVTFVGFLLGHFGMGCP
jgi:hypothetical protein